MTDETQCTALGKIDGKYAKRVSPCCDAHDEEYSKPKMFRRLAADFRWAKCAWRHGEGFGHKAKTVAFTMLLMSFSWLMYYDVDKAIYRRLPFLKRIKDWMG